MGHKRNDYGIYRQSKINRKKTAEKMNELNRDLTMQEYYAINRPTIIVDLLLVDSDDRTITVRDVKGVEKTLYKDKITKCEDFYHYGSYANRMILREIYEIFLGGLDFRLINKIMDKNGIVKERRESEKRENDIKRFNYASRYNAKAKLLGAGNLVFCNDKLLYLPSKDIIRANIPKEFQGFFNVKPFSGCDKLEEVRYDSSSKITSEIISNSTCKKFNIIGKVTSISSAAFQMSTLESINLNKELSEIGGNAFALCKKLKEVHFADKTILKFMGEGVFMGCSSLTEIKLPNGIETIPKGTFTGCTNLEKVFIPKSVMKVYPTAFNNDHKVHITAHERLKSQLKNAGIPEHRMTLYK